MVLVIVVVPACHAHYHFFRLIVMFFCIRNALAKAPKSAVLAGAPGIAEAEARVYHGLILICQFILSY